jgi:hypothetical protein
MVDGTRTFLLFTYHGSSIGDDKQNINSSIHQSLQRWGLLRGIPFRGA